MFRIFYPAEIEGFSVDAVESGLFIRTKWQTWQAGTTLLLPELAFQ